MLRVWHLDITLQYRKMVIHSYLHPHSAPIAELIAEILSDENPLENIWIFERNCKMSLFAINCPWWLVYAYLRFRQSKKIYE